MPTFDDIAEWCPDPDYWRGVLSDAENHDPSIYTNNAWSVGALQAAWSAITHTPVPADQPCRHLVDALGTVIRIGHDTDTTAAIAGALLGARWGISAVPARWRRILHGWPNMTAADLERLGVLIVRGGKPFSNGYPAAPRVDHTKWLYGPPRKPVQHPRDPGVLLGDVRVLDALPDDVDAVVSLCAVGTDQVPAGIEHVTFRLIDSEDPDRNRNLDWLLRDAAEWIGDLRGQGKTVLVHCVAGASRTPAVAIAYALTLGVPLVEARAAVQGTLPGSCPNAGFEAALTRISERLILEPE